jgi:hypothetical protein
MRQTSGGRRLENPAPAASLRVPVITSESGYLALGLARGFGERDDPLALGQHDAPERHQSLAAHRLADDPEGLLPDRGRWG